MRSLKVDKRCGTPFPQAETSLHCEAMDTGLMHLLTSQLFLVLIMPTHGELARLVQPGFI